MTVQDELSYFKGNLTVSRETDPEKMFVSDDEDSIFYHVPRRILSYIDGCPSKVTYINIDFDEDSERVMFCATENEDEKPHFTNSVVIDKLYKIIENEGLKKDDVEDQLISIRAR